MAATVARAADSTELSCPADLVPVTITDPYHFPRPPGSPREALAQQLNMRGYAEGDENWGRVDEFALARATGRAVTYVRRRAADGSVAVELRIGRQRKPSGWTVRQRRNCEPPRTPPTAQEAAAPPTADLQLACDPGYRATNVMFDRRLGSGSPSAREALRAFLASNDGRFSGDETLTEDQFVPLPVEPGRTRVERFAARRADGSWAAVVDIRRYPDSRWRDEGIHTCVRDQI